MKAYRSAYLLLLLAGLGFAVASRADAADATFEKVADDVNSKMVKLFGSGGFKGLTSYGTGIIVSPQGHILTVANQLLDTQDLRVHLADGRRFRAKVLYTEPELDAALLVIKQDEKDKIDLNLEYFDIPAAAKNLKAQTGRLGPGLQQLLRDRHARRADVGAARRHFRLHETRRPPRHFRGALSRRGVLLRPDLQQPRFRRRRRDDSQGRIDRHDRQGIPQCHFRHLDQLRTAGELPDRGERRRQDPQNHAWKNSSSTASKGRTGRS